MKRLGCVLIWALATATPAFAAPTAQTAAAPQAPSGRTSCTGIMGRVGESAPEGRIIRAAPNASARVIGRIPAAVALPDGDGHWPYEFDIIGSQNGWLEINHLSFDQTRGVTPTAPLFQGRGWIAAATVQVGVQTRMGFAEPRHDAPVLIDGRTQDIALEEVGLARLIGCQGNWILADWNAQTHLPPPSVPRIIAHQPAAVVQPSPLTLRAWATGICNVIETTCDGVDGDRPQPR